MKPISLCIVEDLTEIREGVVSLLAMDERFLILKAFTEAETASVELPKWQPDVVIMDINLQGMNGIECMKKVKPFCPDTQFIMFTIYEDDEKVFEALEAGASGYLLKNTPLSRIADSVIEIHEGGAPMTTQIARKVVEKMQIRESPVENNILTTRENEVLQCLSKGWLYKEIAGHLKISIGTVRQHIHNIYEKLHVQNRTEALNKTMRK
jgi:DNA-binding NarL/FixJ family response regulator